MDRWATGGIPASRPFFRIYAILSWHGVNVTGGGRPTAGARSRDAYQRTRDKGLMDDRFGRPLFVELVVAVDDPRLDDIQTVLDQHLAFSRMVTPAAGVHALTLDGLLDPAVTFFSARLDGELVGVGALNQLNKTHAELKSMHTIQTARRRGVGRALVEHLLSVAADRNYRRVSLETGAMDAFAPARSFYANLGFEPCPPFGPYVGSPTSVCMTIELDSGVSARNDRA